jgi:hypothetical protein
MAKKRQGSTAVEGTEPDPFVVDVEEWQAELNLPEDTAAELEALKERFEALNRSFGELLVYANMLDDRVQQLSGEPMVTSTVQSHTGNDGIARVHRMRPKPPELELIKNPKQLEDKNDDVSMLARMVVKR